MCGVGEGEGHAGGAQLSSPAPGCPCPAVGHGVCGLAQVTGGDLGPRPCSTGLPGKDVRALLPGRPGIAASGAPGLIRRVLGCAAEGWLPRPPLLSLPPPAPSSRSLSSLLELLTRFPPGLGVQGPAPCSGRQVLHPPPPGFQIGGHLLGKSQAAPQPGSGPAPARLSHTHTYARAGRAQAWAQVPPAAGRTPGQGRAGAPGRTPGSVRAPGGAPGGSLKPSAPAGEGLSGEAGGCQGSSAAEHRRCAGQGRAGGRPAGPGRQGPAPAPSPLPPRKPALRPCGGPPAYPRACGSGEGGGLTPRPAPLWGVVAGPQLAPQVCGLKGPRRGRRSRRISHPRPGGCRGWVLARRRARVARGRTGGGARANGRPRSARGRPRAPAA